MSTKNLLAMTAALLLASSTTTIGCAATQDADADVDQNESAQSTTPAPPAVAPANGRVGSHGMVLAGTPGTAFLSHIPMFGGPHDVQLIVAGSFRALDGSALSSNALPSSFSEAASFTFLPDRMSLDALRTGALHELRGTVFLGNFEQGGHPLGSRVRFDVSRVVHQHILDSASNADANANANTYFVFGSTSLAFAAHRINGSPSFDEIVRVDLSGANAPSDAELSVGVEATLPSATTRLGEASSSVTTLGVKSFTMKPARVLSCLVGPDFADPC